MAQAPPVQPASTRSGCLLYKDGQFILSDQAAQAVIEIHGPDLALNTGNRVEITGAMANVKPSVAIAAAYMNVASVSPLALGGCLTVASALDARTTVPPPPSGVKPRRGRQ
jgi:hypothetical protein